MKTKFTLPKGFIQVDSPDHPYTYDGPDSLLSDRLGLIAIFKIRENEQNNLMKLLSRLANSLIAYPAETQMLLLVDRKTQNDIFSRLEKYYFNKLIELSDIRKSKSILKDKKSSSTIKSIKDIQKRLFNTQSQIQNNNLDYIKSKDFKKGVVSEIKELKDKAKYIDILTQKEVATKANIYEFDNLIIGTKKLTKSVSDIVELRPYYEYSILSNFVIDNGVPYFNHLKRKPLNISDVPILKHDPIKPIRVASLLGWYLTNSNNINDLANRVPKYFRNR